MRLWSRAKNALVCLSRQTLNGADAGQAGALSAGEVRVRDLAKPRAFRFKEGLSFGVECSHQSRTLEGQDFRAIDLDARFVIRWAARCEEVVRTEKAKAGQGSPLQKA